MRGAFRGHHKVCSTLIRRGADLSLVTKNGETALTKAAFGPQGDLTHQINPPNNVDLTFFYVYLII